MVNFEEFEKIELKVATIIEAEKIEGSEKLLKLQMDLGNEKRQIVSGIAQFYSPENLVGKQIIIIANLEPRTIFGFESQGMLLATEGEKPILISPIEKAENGALLH